MYGEISVDIKSPLYDILNTSTTLKNGKKIL